MHVVDWEFAAQVAGTGLIAVFVVLGILSLVFWLVSLLICRVTTRQGKG